MKEINSTAYWNLQITLSNSRRTCKSRCSLYVATGFRPICLIVILVVLTSCGTQDAKEKENDASYHYTNAIDQYKNREYRASLDSLLKAMTLAPDNTKFMYHLARAYAVVGQEEKAIKWLDKAASYGFFFELETEKDFDAIRKLPAYNNILKQIQEIKKPIGSSQIAFTIPEKDLMPENIAYDPITRTFFVGSSYKRKIIAVDETGLQRNFTTENQDGLWSVWGLKVDSNRRILWVASSVYRGMIGFDHRQFGISCIHKYDLTKQKCVQKYVLDNRPKRHNVNDLAVNSRGDLFITDDSSDTIYWIPQESGRLEVFVRPPHISHPNGICLSDDDKYLYVTHAEGISVIDVQSRISHLLQHPANVTLCGVDGLYFHQNSLIGIQTYYPERVIQFYLTDGIGAVKHARIIEVNNPTFELPTTGVIVKNWLYYIANSQLRRFHEDGTIYAMHELHDIVIMKVRL
jgi:hypothetical protein